MKVFFPRLKKVKIKEAVCNMYASSVKQFIEHLVEIS